MRKMAFEADDAYKQRLSDWVGAEKAIAGSYRRLAIKIALAIKDADGIGHDTLRIWSKKIFTWIRRRPALYLKDERRDEFAFDEVG